MAASQAFTGVLTGDIVFSTRLDAGGREVLARALEETADAMQGAGIPLLTSNLFRGDSFQLVLQDATQICDAALFLRTWFRKTAIPGKGTGLDARLGLGLGPVEYPAEKQELADGTAYRLAATALERAYADKLSRVWFGCPSDALTALVNALLVSAEPYASHLTVPQAQALWWSMQGLTHQEIAGKLDVAQSTVTRALQSAHDKTLHHVRTYLHAQIAAYLSTDSTTKA